MDSATWIEPRRLAQVTRLELVAALELEPADNAGPEDVAALVLRRQGRSMPTLEREGRAWVRLQGEGRRSGVHCLLDSDHSASKADSKGNAFRYQCSQKTRRAVRPPERPC